SNNGSHQAYLDEWRATAPKLGLHLIFVDVHSSNQFESAFAVMMQERPDALSVTADAFHMSQIEWVVDFAAKHRLPTMYTVRDNVAAGGLISYGPSLSWPPRTRLPIRLQPFQHTLHLHRRPFAVARAIGIFLPVRPSAIARSMAGT